MRESLARHREDPVLLVGEGKLTHVARSYGFSRPVLSCEYNRLNPMLYPHPVTMREVERAGRSTEELKEEFHIKEKMDGIKAVMVMSDPVYWGRDIQLIVV